METTNRRWQNHLKSKGTLNFFLDRLQAYALSSSWQFDNGPFYFPVKDREKDDQLSKAFFNMTENFPYEFFIEVTSLCNLKCKMCARNQMERSLGSMAIPVFKKIIDEISEKQPFAYIHFYGIGEPLMDEMLFEKLDYARGKNLTNSIVFTNGQLLNSNNNYKKLVATDISTIGVDLDGFSQETYGKIRPSADFKEAKTGIENLYHFIRSNNLSTRVEIAYQIYSGVNDDKKEMNQFIDWCNKNDYEYKLVPMHSWAGLRSDVPHTKVSGLSDQHRQNRNGPCKALWGGFFISNSGKVALCFQDADVKEEMGDVTTESIETIWKETFLKKQKKHLSNIFDGLCSNCDSFTQINLPPKGSSLYPDSLNY